MAQTYHPQYALEVAKNYAHNIPVSMVDSQIADVVHSWLWCAWPWPWTLAALTPIALVDGTQDYANAHTDFLRWHNARLVRTDTTPDQYNDLITVSHLEPELSEKGGLRNQKYLSWERPLNVFRLERAASVGSGVTLQIQGEYQKKPTRITDANMTSTTVLGFDDHHIGTYIEFLKYYMYKLADDPRAGTVVINKRGDKQYSGQLGLAYDALMRMQSLEDMFDDQQFIFPDTPIGHRGYHTDPTGMF